MLRVKRCKVKEEEVRRGETWRRYYRWKKVMQDVCSGKVISRSNNETKTKFGKVIR